MVVSVSKVSVQELYQSPLKTICFSLLNSKGGWNESGFWHGCEEDVNSPRYHKTRRKFDHVDVSVSCDCSEQPSEDSGTVQCLKGSMQKQEKISTNAVLNYPVLTATTNSNTAQYHTRISICCLVFGWHCSECSSLIVSLLSVRTPDKRLPP